MQTENNNLKIRVSSLEFSLTGKASTSSLTSIIDSLNTLNTKHSNTCAAVRLKSNSHFYKIINFLISILQVSSLTSSVVSDGSPTAAEIYTQIAAITDVSTTNCST